MDEVSVDFSRPWPDGKYIMVLMDEYSRFPIVEVLNSINAKTVIPALDKIFSFTGRPNILKSDNGPLSTRTLSNNSQNIWVSPIGK